MGTRPWCTAAAAAALLVAGCGGQSRSVVRPKLTAREEVVVADARLAFAHTALDGSRYGQSLDGVEQLIELCRAKRSAIYETSRGERLTVRQVLEDAASDLEPYQPEMASRLDRVLAHDCA